MSQLIFDLEATGLLRCGSKIHCLVIQDAETGKQSSYDHKPERPLSEGFERLLAADVIIGHNVINYDIPLLAEQGVDLKADVLDTLVMSRLYYPHMMDLDCRRQPDGLPSRLYGRHSLEAWGYRLKFNKGDFGKQENAWDTYTPEMLDYCQQDVRVTGKLFAVMQRRMDEYP